MMMRRTLVALAFASSFLVLPPAVRADEPETGAHVYSHAIQAMAAIAPPPYVRFHEDVTFSHAQLVFKQQPGPKLQTMILLGKNDPPRAYDVVYRAADGVAAMHSADGKERLVGNPAPWNVMWNEIIGIGKAAGAPSAVTQPNASPAPDSESADATPATIGSVTVFGSRFYRIENAGAESIDGATAFHLRFTPIADPDAHSLREVWVDTATYRFRKAMVRIHKGGTARIDGAITYAFGPVDRYWLATRAHFEATGQIAFYRITGVVDMAASAFSFPDKVTADEFALAP
jgi:hypothetical protein